MEIVGTEHVAAEAPAGDETLVRHLSRTDADVVDRADVPAAMVKAGTAGLREGDHVVIAAVDAVQERDHPARLVGQAQAQYPRVEGERARHVAGEQQHVRHAPRLGGRRLTAHRRPAAVRRRAVEPHLRLRVRRGFLRDAQLKQPGRAALVAQRGDRGVKPGNVMGQGGALRRNAHLGDELADTLDEVGSLVAHPSSPARRMAA